MRLAVSLQKRLSANGRIVAIDVAFDCDAARVVLFGPSGAGKSLTLQALAGLVRPDAGCIAWNDEVWFDSDRRIDTLARRRGVGFMFQDYALFPHLTVAENVGATYRRRGMRANARPAREDVERLLARFELAALRDSYPTQISGGQRQRTALARALAGHPRLLLLDEPFAALDETLRQAARDELLLLQRDCGVPMVIITHDPRDVDALGERVITMDAGRVVDARDVRPPPNGPREAVARASL